MNKSSPLMLSQRFLPMFLTQFFGAFNDNLYKYALLTMFSYGWIKSSALTSDTLNNLAALLFILPFFLFSATAGQLADRYEPTRLIKILKTSEIIAMSIACVGFISGQISLLLFALFLMGVQSAFFGPVKYSILPNLLKEKELITGNALFQSGTSVAILLGMVIGGVAIALAKGNVWYISGLLMMMSLIGYIVCLYIPKQKIADENLVVNWNFFLTSWQIMKLSRQYRLVFYVILCNSWYWFYGATIITQMVQMTRVYLHGSENVSAILLTFFSVGVVIGSALCKKLSGEKVKLSLIYAGAMGLSVFLAYLAWSLFNIPKIPPDQALGIIQIFNSGLHYYHVFLAITLLGISGGLYIVPLYTLMQSQAPETHRARIIAANNIFNSIFMVTAAVFCIIILKLSNLVYLFIITSVLSLIVCSILLSKVRQYFSTLK
ncbi:MULTISPECIES: MFS transporter [unclassified Acinetobacter]|uniref:MFS transporter n=1 Tax=unclassified Acinetobacter TaxID=196816 RepID=UPI0035B890D5